MSYALIKHFRIVASNTWIQHRRSAHLMRLNSRYPPWVERPGPFTQGGLDEPTDVTPHRREGGRADYCVQMEENTLSDTSAESDRLSGSILELVGPGGDYAFWSGCVA